MEYEQQERNWAMGCHLAALIFYIGIPLGNVLGPLVVWLLKKNESELVNQQGKEALNFQISFIVYGLVGMVLAIVLAITVVLIPVAIVIGVLLILLFLLDLIFIIIAAIKTANGESFKYPLTIQFLK